MAIHTPIADELVERIDAVVAAFPFGVASAVKRGRNPRFPYVPIINFGEQKIGLHRTLTEQLRGRAYESRDRAVAYAQRMIDARREHMRTQLGEPRMRAMREQFGLPRELPAIAKARGQ